jgi:hypothetical protein
MIKQSFFSGCIAATIVTEILFAAKQAKRLEWKACVPPQSCSINFFSKNTLQDI